MKIAFPYGILEEQIFMELPPGYQLEGKVVCLKKSIYRLEQVLYIWNHRLVNTLHKMGFIELYFDTYIFVHKEWPFFIAIYMDDLALYGPSDDFIKWVKSYLSKHFQTKDLGDLHWLLGIKIECRNGYITLSQYAYIQTILKQFSIDTCNSVSTLLASGTKLWKAMEEDTPVERQKYQLIIESL